jgi:3-methyl-2-oxobutanoate hydroxymethyltransferase
MDAKKVTINKLHEMKNRRQPIVALGVYDSPMAAIAEEVGFEIFVIGNSGPMSLFGHRRSAAVSPEELLFMTQGVSRLRQRALVVATMPYMSYQASKAEAVKTAAWLVSQGGADCVQCHGNRAIAPNLRAIIDAGIPVLAHIGLQSVNQVKQGGYRLHGKEPKEAKDLRDDALALVEAGVFAFTAELVVNQLTRHLAEVLPVPVLSLGSGPGADGVYLVSGDAVGYSAFPRPSSAGNFVEIMPQVEAGLAQFLRKARQGQYPSEEKTHHMDPAEFDKFAALLAESKTGIGRP